MHGAQPLDTVEPGRSLPHGNICPAGQLWPRLGKWDLLEGASSSPQLQTHGDQARHKLLFPLLWYAMMWGCVCLILPLYMTLAKRPKCILISPIFKPQSKPLRGLTGFNCPEGLMASWAGAMNRTVGIPQSGSASTRGALGGTQPWPSRTEGGKISVRFCHHSRLLCSRRDRLK